jgi:L-ascorbate oxidase
MAVSPFADGTPSASQWPIPPAHFFDYEINVPHGMAGTYFYHSHVGFQAVSAAGPLIVDDLSPPYHYAEERIVFLQDMFKATDKAIEQGLVANPLKWSNETSIILINGKGGGTSNVMASDVDCNSTLSVINVQPGKTYRLRFIGSTALTFGALAFEGHDSLMVIEADGLVLTTPQVCSRHP